jgi:hypothetical protein
MNQEQKDRIKNCHSFDRPGDIAGAWLNEATFDRIAAGIEERSTVTLNGEAITQLLESRGIRIAFDEIQSEVFADMAIDSTMTLQEVAELIADKAVGAILGMMSKQQLAKLARLTASAH